MKRRSSAVEIYHHNNTGWFDADGTVYLLTQYKNSRGIVVWYVCPEKWTGRGPNYSQVIDFVEGGIAKPLSMGHLGSLPWVQGVCDWLNGEDC